MKGLIILLGFILGFLFISDQDLIVTELEQYKNTCYLLGYRFVIF